MKKLYLFLFFFYSKLVFSFAPVFETVDSSTGSAGGTLSERLLANAPYSLCELDVPYISRENCNLVSLLLGGPNYLRWVLEGKDIDQSVDYFLSITVPDINNLLDNYHVNPTVEWYVPTIGQLSRLINMGMVDPSDNRYYWVRSEASPTSFSRVRYRPSGPSTEPNAALERLVSQNLGSDPVTDLVPDIEHFISLFSNIFGASTRLTINYTNASGQAVTDSLVINNQQHRRYDLPLNATNVTIQACQAEVSVCASRVAIDFGTYAGACATTTGSALISTRLSVSYTSASCTWE